MIKLIIREASNGYIAESLGDEFEVKKATIATNLDDLLKHIKLHFTHEEEHAVIDQSEPDTGQSEPDTGQSEVPGVELDSDGLPHDSRIHADSRGKIKDGTWRKKRNLDQAMVESVEAELRATMSANGKPDVSWSPSDEQPEPLWSASDESDELPEGYEMTEAAEGDYLFYRRGGWKLQGLIDRGLVRKIQPTISVAPPPPAASVAPPPPAESQFPELMVHLSKLTTEGKVTQPQLDEIAGHIGLPGVFALSNRQDLIPAYREKLDATIA